MQNRKFGAYSTTINRMLSDASSIFETPSRLSLLSLDADALARRAQGHHVFLLYRGRGAQEPSAVDRQKFYFSAVQRSGSSEPSSLPGWTDGGAGW
jgi:hypothetical protein